MNSSIANSTAKKVTVTVETEEGMTFSYLFGGEGAAKLHVIAAINQELSTLYADSYHPVSHHVTRREFSLKINY